MSVVEVFRVFQPDLYPPFCENTPNSDFATWISGTDKPSLTMELRPEKKSSSLKHGKAGGLAARLGGGSQVLEPIKGNENVDELR